MSDQQQPASPINGGLSATSLTPQLGARPATAAVRTIRQTDT